jgi:hypothetical protein
MDALDVRQQGIIAYTSSARLVTAGALVPLMISAGADVQRFTED